MSTLNYNILKSSFHGLPAEPGCGAHVPNRHCILDRINARDVTGPTRLSVPCDRLDLNVSLSIIPDAENRLAALQGRRTAAERVPRSAAARRCDAPQPAGMVLSLLYM